MADLSLLKAGDRLREAGARYIHAENDVGGRTYQDIATELGISIGTVYNVRTGRTWKWVLEEYRAHKAAAALP